MSALGQASRAALWPLGAAWMGAARVRARLYASGLLASSRLPHPTIAVGNLTMGGTGKTPIVGAIAEFLLALGFHPAILSRGYGRTTTGPRVVTPHSSSTEVGEEALLLARRLPGVPVAVAERRELAASLVADACDVFLLDDAFQHLRVRRDVNLLLVDTTRPNDLRFPPLGHLREPLRAARRASAVIVTRGTPDELPEALAPLTHAIPVFGARFVWGALPLGTMALSAWADLAGERVLAFAGIGHPAAFFQQARDHGLSPVREVRFPDHANPTPARLALLLREVSATKASAVLTTEKDAVKWASVLPASLPLVYPSLAVQWEGDVPALKAMLVKCCQEDISR